MTSPVAVLRRAPLLSLVGLLAVVLAACGGSAAAPSDDSSGGGTIAVVDGAVDIGADNLEFNANVIQAIAGEAFTVTLVNNDSVPHNFSVYTSEGGDEVVIGEIIDAGGTVVTEVPALDAGEYFFVCDVHPTTMTGSVVVEG